MKRSASYAEGNLTGTSRAPPNTDPTIHVWPPQPIMGAIGCLFLPFSFILDIHSIFASPM